MKAVLECRLDKKGAKVDINVQVGSELLKIGGKKRLCSQSDSFRV
jgi:hypothetical protein